MNTRARKMVMRVAGGAVGCFAACLSPAAGARSLERVSGPGRLSSYFLSASPDGSRVYFATRERLTADDRGSGFDLYRRRGPSFTRISPGVDGHQLAPATADLEEVALDFVAESPGGSRVIFYSDAPLTRDDRDRSSDLFEWRRGRLRRLSRGTRGGNGNHDVYVGATSRDAQRVVFTTDERLSPADHDRTFDVYERAGSRTTLLSPAPVAGRARDVFVSSASSDARRLILSTEERLTSDDTDQRTDLYELYRGQLARVSQGASGGNGNFTVYPISQAYADAKRVLFSTVEPLTPDDTDATEDIYERAGGETRGISTGPSGGNGPLGGPTTPLFYFLFAASRDGTQAYFTTPEPLSPEDQDAENDIYLASGGTTTLVSGPAEGRPGGPRGGDFTVDRGRFESASRFLDADRSLQASADGSRVFFSTSERLTADDLDRSRDVYAWSGGRLTRVSTGSKGGNGRNNCGLESISADGTRVIFSTAERLEPDDKDASVDIYERVAGETRRVSGRRSVGNGRFGSRFVAASPDARRVYFETQEGLVSGDRDRGTDVYLSRE